MSKVPFGSATGLGFERLEARVLLDGSVLGPVQLTDSLQAPSLLVVDLSPQPAAFAIQDTQFNAKVIDRHLFYNHSNYDGNNSGANEQDDNAIATDKRALLPGEVADFSNYSSYVRGINGIMVDILGLGSSTLSVDNFAFKVGNNNDPQTWSLLGHQPVDITVRPGAGIDGSDRVTIIFEDHLVQQQWLEVTVRATEQTGLAQNDVFYFGNAIGETGDGANGIDTVQTAIVDMYDVIGVRASAPASHGRAGLGSRYDFNRDTKVNVTDLIALLDNRTNAETALRLIHVTHVPPGSIHGLKWSDINGNGQHDADEPGLAGVTIYLDFNGNGELENNELSTKTMRDDPATDFDESGHYWIKGVPAGDYIVREVVPDGFEQTFPGPPVAHLSEVTATRIGAGGAFDFDVINAVAHPAVDPQEADVDMTFEVSWGTPCSTLISSLTSQSVSGNKIEVDLFGRTLGGACIQVVPPPEHETVNLENLTAGNYELSATLREARLHVLPIDVNQSNDENLSVVDLEADTDYRPLFETTWLLKAKLRVEAAGGHRVRVTPGQAIKGIDFGNQPMPGSIHGVKWLDRDGDGERDADEPGLPGVTIYADINHNGQLDDGEPHTVTMKEDPNTRFEEAGRYWLSDLPPDQYVVREVVPEGYDQTFPKPNEMRLTESVVVNDTHIEVSPTAIDVILASGESFTTDVSAMINPFCIRPYDVDVVASDSDVLLNNLSGILINGCGGDTSTFKIELTGSGTPQAFDIQFVDAEFGGVLAAIPVVVSVPGSGGAHFVTLEPGDVVEGIDFGNRLILPGSVHGTKWEDVNGNSQRDNDEPGLAGVVIYSDRNFNGVLDQDEPRTKSMQDDPVTDFDETGLYWLDGLDSGYHLIREIVPDGYTQTFPWGSILESSDLVSDTAFSPEAHFVFVHSGQAIDGIDFGNQLIRKSSIHGVKWMDTNGNGQRDDNEPGLPGVTIYLDLNGNAAPDANELRTKSMEDDPNTDFDESGLYWFTGLSAGDFTVREVVPDEFVQTFPGPVVRLGDVTATKVMSGAAFGFGVTDAEAHPTFGFQESDVDMEFEVRWGTVCSSLIPSLTSQEVSDNKIQVDLFGRTFSGPCIAVVPTPEHHTVEIENLPDGDYKLSATLHEAKLHVLPIDANRTNEQGLLVVDLETDSNIRSLFVETWILSAKLQVESEGGHRVHLDPGGTVDGIDFGNQPIPRGSIHGVKWEDLNGDGKRDDHEPGLAGVKIYSDLNRNGVLDAGEPATKTMEDDPVTDFDEAGLYWLDALRPGKHVVREVVPNGFVQTFPRSPILLAGDSGSLITTPPGAHYVDLNPGESIDGVDFGNQMIRPGSIHGVKWEDLNGDGHRSSDEPGLAGVTIYSDLNRNGVLDANEPSAKSMKDDPITDFDELGMYWLVDLKPGAHVIREVVPDGYIQTFPANRILLAEDVVAPIIFPIDGHLVFLNSGQTVEGIDFGNQRIKPGSIHGIKWEDLNGDRQRNSDEPGLAGVTIYSDLNFNGVLDKNEPHAVSMKDDPDTDFDETGMYWLNDLKPGAHVVREVVPDGFVQTFPIGFVPISLSVIQDSASVVMFRPGAHYVWLQSGEVVEGIDFGNQQIKPGSIHGIKWEDLNGDGHRNDDEPGLAGVTIYSDWNFNGVLDDHEPRAVSMKDDPATARNETGMYWLEGLRPGGHVIREVVPEGFIQTFPRGPILLGTNSVTTDLVAPGVHYVFLGSGETIDGINFGNQRVKPGSIHGAVWEDFNGDGKQDDKEAGLAGVVVYSDLNFNGVLDDNEPRTKSMQDDPTTIVNELGQYWLNELAPGAHAIRQVVPNGFVQTFPVVVGSSLVSSDDLIAAVPGSHHVQIGFGQEINGINFGNRPIDKV